MPVCDCLVSYYLTALVSLLSFSGKLRQTGTLPIVADSLSFLVLLDQAGLELTM